MNFYTNFYYLKNELKIRFHYDNMHRFKFIFTRYIINIYLIIYIIKQTILYAFVIETKSAKEFNFKSHQTFV